jgi:cell shape-determining protein MreC
MGYFDNGPTNLGVNGKIVFQDCLTRKTVKFGAEEYKYILAKLERLQTSIDLLQAENKELKDRLETLEYAPGGIYYQQAKQDFDTLLH